MKRTFWLPVLLAVPLAAQAQFVAGAKVEPAQPRAGRPATITVNFDVKDGIVNCGVRLRFSDGGAEQYHKVNQAKDVPLVVPHVFTKPGEHVVYVEPRSKLPTFKCGGGDVPLRVKVLAR